MRQTEYDFLVWTSFPSSAKLINDERGRWASKLATPPISVRPGAILTVQVKGKQQNVLYSGSHVRIDGWNGTAWVRMDTVMAAGLPFGSFDWGSFTVGPRPVSPAIVAVRAVLNGGAGTPEVPGETWFDDLKIIQDDILIYQNEFSDWNPIIGAVSLGILAPAAAVVLQKEQVEKQPLLAVAASLLGALTGAGIGLVVPPLEIPLVQ